MTVNLSHETETKTDPCRYIRGILKKPILIVVTINFHVLTGSNTRKHLR